MKNIIIFLKDEKFTDFEDCIQAECAITAKAEYIITRNAKHFYESAVKPVLPEDFLKVIAE